MTLCGFKIYAVQHMTLREQFRWPRSKKRRIRKKWARLDRNWRSRPDPNLIFDEVREALYGHPATIEALRHRLARDAADPIGDRPQVSVGYESIFRDINFGEVLPLLQFLGPPRPAVASMLMLPFRPTDVFDLDVS